MDRKKAITINRIMIIGNLCADPQLRSTKDGIPVASFTIAVNRKGKDNETDFFKITAWRQLGELCAKYLAKGRKVCVIGSVSASAYLDKEGKPKASLEVNADEIEFLSSKLENSEKTEVIKTEVKKVEVFTPVADDSDLPF